jgi:predicted GNAT family acetyltransferase
MSDSPVTAADGEWHAAPRGLAFSDYGEWLDEGTTSLIEDVAARAADPTADRAAVPVPPSDCGIDVRHDEAHQTYGAWIGHEQIGHLTYKLVGNRIALWTTMVLPAYRRHGVATELVAEALDDIRSTGKTITVICPIVREVIDRYPQYRDLVDAVHPGVIGAGAA